MKSYLKQFHYDTNKYIRNTLYLCMILLLIIGSYKLIFTPLFQETETFKKIDTLVFFIWSFLTFGYRIGLHFFHLQWIAGILQVIYFIFVYFLYSLTSHGTGKIKVAFFLLVVVLGLYLSHIN